MDIDCIVQKMVKTIKDNILLTKGVYAVVRNPIYSAFFFVFTGMLLIEANLWLLILPIVFWLYMTILLKLTEEKCLKVFLVKNIVYLYE